MAAPIFLDIEQVMTILLGEMPQGTYATDRADSPDYNRRSYSSSEIRAHAQVYADLYANLLDIYENKFISTVQADGIGRWETDLFSLPVDSSLPFSTRQQNLITKWRARGGLSYPYINDLVSSVLTPLGLPFYIAVLGGLPMGGAWLLDISSLGLDTYLSDTSPLFGAVQGVYQLDCNARVPFLGNTVNTSFTVSGIPTGVTSKIQVGAGITGSGIPSGTTVLSKSTTTLTMSQAATLNQTQTSLEVQNYIAAGLTEAQFVAIQAMAYTYVVYIYGNANAQTLSTLDQLLTQVEPGGTTHLIFNNSVPPGPANIIDLGSGVGATLTDIFDFGDATQATDYGYWDLQNNGGF